MQWGEIERTPQQLAYDAMTEKIRQFADERGMSWENAVRQWHDYIRHSKAGQPRRPLTSKERSPVWSIEAAHRSPTSLPARH